MEIYLVYNLKTQKYIGYPKPKIWTNLGAARRRQTLRNQSEPDMYVVHKFSVNLDDSMTDVR